MQLSDTFLDELNSRTDITDLVGEYVVLNRKGNKYWGLCPFHSEKTASFSVSPDRQMYYCFGCHKGGGAINFMMELESLGFRDAVEILAKRVGMQMPEDSPEEQRTRGKRERILELNRLAARWFHKNLNTPAGAAGTAYLQKRRLSAATVTRFGLGVAPAGWDNLLRAMAEKGYSEAELLEAGLAVKNSNGHIYDRFRNRVMFPIIDVRGSVIGFGGRVLDEATPKYLNSPDTPVYNKSRNFFALNVAKKSKQGRIILTEGYMDAIALHQAGFDCAVASLGTSLTEEHAKLLSNYTGEVIVSYDADSAGVSAAQRAITLLQKTGMKVRVLRIPNGKDPDEFIRDHGCAAFAALLDESANHIEYQLQQIRSRYDLTQDDQRINYLRECAKLLARLDSPLEREIYGKRAATAADISFSVLEDETNRLRRQSYKKQKKSEERQAMSPTRMSQPQEHSLRYQNVPSARAEEGIIRLLLMDSDFFRQVEALTPAHFSSPTLSRIFSLLQERWRKGESCSVATLTANLTSAEMSHLAALQQQPETMSNGKKAMADYINTIQRQRSAADDSALMSFRSTKKNNGGTSK